MTQTLYAIGDIHGDLEQLQTAHAMIEDDAKGRAHTVIHIGDLVDRRPDSKPVIDYLMSGQTAGKPWVVLRGNHDRMFAIFLQDPFAADPILRPDYTWLHPRLGGRTTLLSYGVEYAEDKPLQQLHAEAVAAVPPAHLNYLLGLPNVWQNNRYFFCHAGVKPGVPLDQQIEDDLIWIRQPFHVSAEYYAKVIVHGHTPVDEVVHYGNRINIDTGAAYGKKLSTIVLEGADVRLLTANGRQDVLHLPPGHMSAA